MNHQNATLDHLIGRDEVDLDRVVELLIDRYYTDLCYLARTILHDAADAEDVTQETLIRAVGKLHQYQPGTNLKAWLYTITVNLARKAYRKQQVRQKIWGLLQDARTQAPPASPEDLVVQREADAQLWNAVNTLKEKQRLPIILRYLHGLSCREIAEILDIREGTVRSRLHYGTQKIKGRLQRGNRAMHKDRKVPR